MIKSKWGNFEKGEEIAIVMHGPCGREYVYKGMVHGVRTCMGKQYLMIRSEDGHVYEVSETEASQILRGQEAKARLEKTYRMRQERIKKWEEEEAEKAHEKEHYHKEYSEPAPKTYSPKYNRI